MKNRASSEMEMAKRRQRILAEGFRLFSKRPIDKVSMNEVAEASGIGIATLYRYYSDKPSLVVDISTQVWSEYIESTRSRPDSEAIRTMTAAQRFERFLDSFIDLYLNHRDMLRFNQFFNIYAQSEGIPGDRLTPFTQVIRALAGRFHEIYETGQRDGTLRTEIPEQKIFTSSLHLMLAAVTRYAVGVIYAEDSVQEELSLLRNMLLREYTRAA